MSSPPQSFPPPQESHVVFLYFYFPEEIPVDTDLPEAHGDYIVDLIQNISVTTDSGTQQVDMYKIQTSAHICDVQESLHEAYLVSNNRILLVGPSPKARMFRQDSKARQESEKEFGLYNKEEANERLIQENFVARNPRRGYNLTLLCFGEDVELTGKHFTRNFNHGKLHDDFFPVETSSEFCGHTVTTTSMDVVWKVTVIPLQDRILSQGTGPVSNEERLARMFGSRMNISKGK